MAITLDGTNGITTPSQTTNGDVIIADKIVHLDDTNTAIRFPAADTVTVETAGTERLRIAANGNVGIGTTSPAEVLQVVGGNLLIGTDSGDAFNAKSKIRIQGTGDEYIQIKSDGTGQLGLLFGYTTDDFTAGILSLQTAGNDLSFFANNATRMTIDNAGNVGIGTTTPAGRLHARFDAGVGDGYTGKYIFQSLDQRLTIGTYYEAGVAQNARIQSSSGSGVVTPLILNPDGGNLLVGTTTALALATFEKTTEASPVIVAKNPQYSLDCWATNTTGSNIFVRFFTETSATLRGSITYNRGGGLVAYNTTSDYRAKDINGEISDASSTVLSLKAYMGTMKGATIERPMFIAHETQEIAPYAVTGEKDAVDTEGNPTYQQMDHSALVPLLTAALQEALAEIANLKTRIEALENTQ